MLKSGQRKKHLNQQSHKVTFSDNVTVIPTNPMPRRAVREVANLDPTIAVGNNGSPARNTRARFAVAAAAVSAVMTNSKVDAQKDARVGQTIVAYSRPKNILRRLCVQSQDPPSP